MCGPDDPTSSGAPAPASTPPGARIERRLRMLPNSTGSRAPATTATPQVPALRGVDILTLIPRAAVLQRPHLHRQVPALSCPGTGIRILRTVVLPHPHQHLQVRVSSGGIRTYPYPTGSRAPAPIAAPPGARPRRRVPTLSRTKSSRVPAPTSTPAGALPRRLRHTSPSSTGSHAPGPTSTPPGAGLEAQVPASHGQPYSRAHCSTFKCPPSAAC